MTTINENPKCQLNFSVRRNGSNEIIERSTLLNIRCDDFDETVELYKKMKVALNGELSNEVHQEQETQEPFPDNLFRKDKTCPQCGSEMILRKAKNGRSAGNSFFGCKNWPNCKHTEPTA